MSLLTNSTSKFTDGNNSVKSRKLMVKAKSEIEFEFEVSYE